MKNILKRKKPVKLITKYGKFKVEQVQTILPNGKIATMDMSGTKGKITMKDVLNWHRSLLDNRITL